MRWKAGRWVLVVMAWVLVGVGSAQALGTGPNGRAGMRQEHAVGAGHGCLTYPGALPPDILTRREHGTLRAISWLPTWGSSTCRISAKVKAAVVRWSKTLSRSSKLVVRSVRRTGSVVRVRRHLKPGDVVVRAWRWRNWCGSRHRLAIRIRWGRPALARSRRLLPPSCRSHSRPSTLSVTRIRLPRCKASRLRLQSFLAGGMKSHTIEGLTISVRRGRPCVLRARPKLTLQHKGGGVWSKMGSIRGNPGRQRTGAVLAHGHSVTLYWGWWNWCGRAYGSFRLLGALGTHRANRTFNVAKGTSSGSVPFCGAPDKPSTLSASYGYL